MNVIFSRNKYYYNQLLTVRHNKLIKEWEEDRVGTRSQAGVSPSYNHFNIYY